MSFRDRAAHRSLAKLDGILSLGPMRNGDKQAALMWHLRNTRLCAAAPDQYLTTTHQTSHGALAPCRSWERKLIDGLERLPHRRAAERRQSTLCDRQLERS